MVQYRSNPELPFIKKGWPGNPVIDGRFVNEMEREQPEWGKLWRWMRSTNPQQEEKRNDQWRLKVISEHDLLQGDEDGLVWLGHATFLIRLDGVSILTDPNFSDSRFLRRLCGLAFPVERLRGIDQILISHGHRDHLHLATLRTLKRQNPLVQFLTPLGMGKVLTRLGKVKVQEAGWYQGFDSGAIDITLLPSQHWHRRALLDFNKVLWGGFHLNNGRRSIYFPGDTAYSGLYQEFRELLGAFDICCMPIGAYKPDYIMKDSHMTPAEAVEAFNELDGKTFVPMHYGTYDLSDEPLGEPLRLLRELEAEGKVEGELKVLKVGEALMLE